jgi:hypothetical protein
MTFSGLSLLLVLIACETHQRLTVFAGLNLLMYGPVLFFVFISRLYDAYTGKRPTASSSGPAALKKIGK